MSRRNSYNHLLEKNSMLSNTVEVVNHKLRCKYSWPGLSCKWTVVRQVEVMFFFVVYLDRQRPSSWLQPMFYSDARWQQLILGFEWHVQVISTSRITTQPQLCINCGEMDVIILAMYALKKNQGLQSFMDSNLIVSLVLKDTVA